jgi:long-chain acyl-CoA synthetase
MQCAEVVEAATIGVPDAIYGEEVVSYVVGRPGATLDTEALFRHCAANLPAFKAPKRIVLASALPKTERGKLDRKALARSATAAPTPRPGRASARPSASFVGEGKPASRQRD